MRARLPLLFCTRAEVHGSDAGRLVFRTQAGQGLVELGVVAGLVGAELQQVARLGGIQLQQGCLVQRGRIGFQHQRFGTAPGFAG